MLYFFSPCRWFVLTMSVQLLFSRVADILVMLLFWKCCYSLQTPSVCRVRVKVLKCSHRYGGDAQPCRCVLVDLLEI